MMNTAIDIRSDRVKKGVHDYAKFPSVTVNKDAQFTFGSILSRYGNLTPESLHYLDVLKTKSMCLKKNQKIYSLCQGKSEVFVVKKGWVSLSHAFKGCGDDVCNVFMPGDIVGIRESFFNNHDIAMLALEDCQLEKLSVDEVHNLFNDYADIKKAVVSYIMVNDNVSIERLRSCTHHKAEERVAHFLLEVYARCLFKELIDSREFAFPVTQEVVGQLLGITGVHVSRCMTALEQKKLIRKSRSKIKLLEPELLAELTGFDFDLFYGHVSFVKF